jgi:parallel beta-helix repeat protein
MSLPTLYPAQVGSPYSILAAPYTSGESTMALVDATKLPTAPNIVCLAGDVAGEFSYTGKEGNVLQGVTALPGTPAATTWPTGTFAFRGIAAYDLNAIHENMVRAGTYVVAASNAPAHVKQRADYVCDGTADDVEIQAAIDALPATGGKVSLSEGTFTTAATITLKSFVTLEGCGRSTIIRLGAGLNLNVITASGVSECEIRDLKIDGNKANNIGQDDANLQNGILFEECYRSSIRDVMILNCWESGIRVKPADGSAASKLMHNIFSGIVSCFNRKNGISFDTWAEYMMVDACSFSNNGQNGVYGVGANLAFTNCIIIQNALAGVSLATSAKTYNNAIEACQINHNLTHGIILHAAHNTLITGCKIIANERHGVWIYGCHNTILTGNTISTNSYGNPDTYDNVFCDTSLYGVISGNTVLMSSGGARYGINEEAKSNYNLIAGNMIGPHTTGAKVVSGANSVDDNNVVWS